jgi:hypothetical protein
MFKVSPEHDIRFTDSNLEKLCTIPTSLQQLHFYFETPETYKGEKQNNAVKNHRSATSY